MRGNRTSLATCECAAQIDDRLLSGCLGELCGKAMAGGSPASYELVSHIPELRRDSTTCLLSMVNLIELHGIKPVTAGEVQ